MNEAELKALIEECRKFIVIYALPAAVEKNLPATEIAARELLAKIYGTIPA